MKQSQQRFRTRGGFTLVEVLASMAVLVVLILALTRMFMEASNITKRGTTALLRNSGGSTVLETILKDTESMAVNARLPCYIVADTVDSTNGFGFDEFFFITTAGDQDDDRAYQLRRYYVKDRIETNSMGVAIRRFQLFRDVFIFAVADDENPGLSPPKIPTDVMAAGMRWWENAYSWGEETVMLADNVVRFDIYALGWDGEEWMSRSAGLQRFDSTKGPQISGLTPAEVEKFKNVPPAAFDIYLQITSPEAAQEGGMALLPGVPQATQDLAREMMFRESSSLFGRATPVMGASQYHHPAIHYTGP